MAIDAWYDGDMGGDDIIAIKLMLAEPDRFNVIGFSTVFGNVDVEQATSNIANMLSSYELDYPIYTGAEQPLYGELKQKDNAYGHTGLGDISYTPSNVSCAVVHTGPVDAMYKALSQRENKVLIFATGPLTNIAKLLNTYPDIHKKIADVIIMGGAVRPGPHPNPPSRIGNITLHSEYNFYQDPYAAHIVLNSKVPVSLVMADASQQIHVTSEMKKEFLRTATGEKILGLLEPAATHDIPKFGTEGPFFHDGHTLLYACSPYDYLISRVPYAHVEQYIAGENCSLDNQRQGRLHLPEVNDENAGHNRLVIVKGILNPESVIDRLFASVRKFESRFKPKTSHSL